MSNQKERYYWTQLRRALAEGQWSSTYPAKTPNGIALTWSELLRKFNKHCKGFHDVAEVASQTHALALLLSANSTDDDQDDPPESGVYPLDIASECSLPEERIEEATAGYEVLKGLKSSNFDVSLKPDLTKFHLIVALDAQFCTGILCLCPGEPYAMSIASQ